MKSIQKLVGLLLTGAALPALCAPVACSYGYQDARCVPSISAGWQAPPTCAGSPGWTTTAPAQWIGSQYTAPQCSYQAPPSCSTGAGWTTAAPAQWTGSQWTSPQCSYQPPPTCQSGFHETAAASWNGSAWVGQQCQPDVLDAATVCASVATPGYSPQQSYQWYDAYVYNGGSGTNWPVVRQSAGQPADAHPYWAENQPDKGWSIGWTGPTYPTCSGGSSLYHATCWVSGNSATITMGAGSTPIPQNGCGLQH